MGPAGSSENTDKLIDQMLRALEVQAVVINALSHAIEALDAHSQHDKDEEDDDEEDGEEGEDKEEHEED